MKNRGKSIFVSALLLAIISICSINKVSAQGYGRISFDVFYNELSPYGYWDNDPYYGDIWFPDAGPEFRPYGSNGYWTMTQYGNTWISNYSWGWAPFHYGRWVHTPRRGWGWIPGYEWGPAWVDWRSGNGYYGWAPMPPRIGINVSISPSINLWIFAPTKRIYDRNIYRYSYNGRPNIYNNTTIINNTYIVNNNHYYGGPSRRDIERTTGRRVTVRDVQESNRPGTSRVDRNTVSMYRPDREVSRASTSRRGEEPSRGQSSTTGRRDNNSPSREMYIGRDGSTTIRERTDNSSSRRPERVTSTNERDNNARGNDRTNSSSRTERPTYTPERENSSRGSDRNSSTSRSESVNSGVDNNRTNQRATERPTQTRRNTESNDARGRQSTEPQIRRGESRPQQQVPQRTTEPQIIRQASNRTESSRDNTPVTNTSRTERTPSRDRSSETQSSSRRTTEGSTVSRTSAESSTVSRSSTDRSNNESSRASSAERGASSRR